jgi:hypothetical protein
MSILRNIFGFKKRGETPNGNKYIETENAGMTGSDRIVYSRFMRQANVEWQQKMVDSFYLYHPYLADNLRNLKICQKCLQLYGPIKLEDGKIVEQKCSCNRSRDDELWYVTIGGRNYYHKFNREYYICSCCGLEIIPSGSQWSSLYCRDCKNRIHKLNQAIGHCAIPLGRHSLMNGISISGGQLIDEKAISRFVSDVNNMNSAIILVDDNRKVIVKKQMQLLQITEDSPAIDLVLKSARDNLGEIKDEALFGLMAFLFNKTVDESREFYQNTVETNRKAS